MSNLPDYQTLELLIGTATPAGYPLTVTQSPAGEATAHCRLDPADGELGDALAAVAARKVDADFLIQVGAFLFDELFCGEIGQIYRTSLGMVRGQGQRLRVRLRIEPPELAGLPWELLHDAQEEQSFAISPEIALVRYVPMRLPVRPSAVTLPLRLLVVLASPIDQPGLDVTTERRHIEEALQERVAKGEVQVTFLEAATVANLQQALRTVQPHIFHFVGHGIFDGERAQLVLADEQDRSALIDERTFRELFAGSSETRVAVLNACESGSTSTVAPLVGLAPRLLQRQLSAVVAMQYAITDQAGLIFAREFYRSLAVGLPVDAAIDEARRGIWLELGADQPDWGAPVLFMRAADGQLFAVKESDSTPSITPPPAPTPPPEVVRFVGRAQELAEFSAHLHAHGLAVITGMAGIGKSSFAAMLAKQMGETASIFWHTFHTVEDIETVIWKLAAFLAWHQRTDLWNLLQTAKQSGGQPPPPSILLDYLFELLHGTGFVLCLDDFQKVEQAPLTKRFLTLLQQAVSANDLKVILISRHTVDLPNGNGSPPLRGLNQADAHRLLETHGLTIDETIFRQLYSATEGNAELLTLAIAVLTEKQNAEQTIQGLVASDNIERFLLMEIDSHLNNDEKAVMSGVAALLGYPGTRTAIEEVLDGSNVARTVAYLCNRNLLFARMGVREREYGEHAIVQSFYYGLLSRRERTAMHLRAATYYESEDVDDLRAALHYFHGRKFDRAATLATRDPAGQISQGRSQALLALLEQLPLHELPEEMQAQLLSVRGDLHYFLFALDDANSCYEAALAKSAGASSTAEAEVARKMAEVLARRGDYQHALTYAEKADRLYQTAKPTVEGALLLAITHGSILMNLGHYHQAKAMAEAQVAQCDVRTSPRLVAELQDLLGKIATYAADTPTALRHFIYALELRQRYGDPRELMRSYSYLAVAYSRRWQWRLAENANVTALALAERIGDRAFATQIEANLAAIHLAEGAYFKAIELLEQCQARYEQMDNVVGLQQVTGNLAYAYLKLNRLSQAAAHANRAITMAETIEQPWQLVKSILILGEIEYEQGQLQKARQRCEEAQRLITTTGMAAQSEYFVLLGKIHYHAEQPTQAAVAFQQAVECCLQQEAWAELAQTKLLWARMALHNQARTQAEQLLAEVELLVADNKLVGLQQEIRELHEMLAENPS